MFTDEATNLIINQAINQGPMGTLNIRNNSSTGNVLVALEATVIRAAAAITPRPLTITLPAGKDGGTGTVTLTNTATDGAPVAITEVTVSGGSLATYFFNKVATAGADSCTGASLAPGATCTVQVRFSNLTSKSGEDQTGKITFTDNAAGSPQTAVLTGHANP